jgi:hypothetical protein
MAMDGYMIGLLVMMVMLFASSRVNEKAMKKLSAEEKGTAGGWVFVK